jgi:hypothetical protein
MLAGNVEERVYEFFGFIRPMHGFRFTFISTSFPDHSIWRMEEREIVLDWEDGSGF